MTGVTYKDAGVNVELGDQASKMLYNAARQTWRNRKGRIGYIATPNNSFSALRGINIGALPKKTMLSMGLDGTGTKVVVAQSMAKHDTIAYDLIAMLADDAVRYGAEPILIGSILDVNSLGSDEHPRTEEMRQLAQGYIGAAKAANVAIINGEIAELGALVQGIGPFNYNWGGSCICVYRSDREITGEKIKPGQSIVSLRERGFRANGLSLVRKILSREYGKDWHKRVDPELLDAILTPSTIYSKAIVDLVRPLENKGLVPVTGIAHITGGGIPGKLGRVLEATGYGATLSSPMEPSAGMQRLLAMGEVKEAEAYRSLNMGNGMLVVTDDPSAVVEHFASHGLESRIAGTITKKPGIRVVSPITGNKISFPRAA